MKTVSASILILIFFSASWTGLGLFNRSDSTVIGGAYVIHQGQVVTGNLSAMFAQVTIEAGAQVQGRILSISSTLDIGGSVNGEIFAVDSDITVRQGATLDENPQRVDAIPYVLLLPRLTQLGNSTLQAQ